MVRTAPNNQGMLLDTSPSLGRQMLLTGAAAKVEEMGKSLLAVVVLMMLALTACPGPNYAPYDNNCCRGGYG